VAQAVRVRVSLSAPSFSEDGFFLEEISK